MFDIFTPIDLAAFIYFFSAIVVYRYLSGPDALGGRSMPGAIQAQRALWMANMAARGDHRTMDIILLNNLAQGNAFFASTTALIVGGMAAVMGSGDRAQAALERLPYAAQSNPILWELKLVTIIMIFLFAFFKFAWAFRLGGYTAIMIGATPLVTREDETLRVACEKHAARTARLAGLSAEHANSGLRAFYYAIAVLAWFYHPIAFIAATTWIIVILARRDYFSRSLAVIRG